MSVESRIKELRNRYGYTQEEMADVIGTQRPNYSSIENGRIELSVGKLVKIARKLKTTPNYLLDFSDESPHDDWLIEISQSSDVEKQAIKEIWNTLKKMKEEQK